MKLPMILLTSLALVSTVHAQYFSEGWKPGKPVSKAAPTSTGFTPVATSTERAKSPFDLSTYLESGPLKALFNRAGVNITEKLDMARELAKIWDPRIPFITDDNYEDLIVNEELTIQEEMQRVWVIVITITSAQAEGISKFVDQQFDKAYDLTAEAGDLPNVKWGRIDYMNVTSLTTKWGVWRAPYLVIAQHRGQTLRFYRPHQIRLKAEILREYLLQESYKDYPAWDSPYAPGGPRAFVFEWLAVVMTRIYDVVRPIPRWLLLIITGTLGSVLVNLLHRNKTQAPPEPEVQRAVAPAVSVPAAEVPPSPSTAKAGGAKSGGAKQRKGGKK
ncbi:hypothetical protein BD410DRAFT_779774 [Rickenella mellea]|uniref:Thioredoxin-like fold domain-containing protein n=1 Tax=Rickenella mellea TaxID=50990 RepID=A0A4R5XE59_9AGAM|nr:hypothetical protein BD410DRAFT_779774 [Rickenella mellea]